MTDKTVKLKDVLDLLESMMKEYDKRGFNEGYIALMDFSGRVQKIQGVKDDKT